MENELQFAMETYGIPRIQVNGQEALKSNFVDYSQVLPIQEFRILDEGGCEIYVKDDPIPLRACFNSRTAHVHEFKKIIPTMLRTMKGPASVFYIYKYWPIWIEFCWHGMKDVFMERKFYQQPVREVYDLIEHQQIRDIICAVLEHDDAYRYRFQDIVGELDKEAFEKNPYKEIRRLVGLYAQREHSDINLTKRMQKAAWLLCIILFFNRKLRRKIKEIVRKMDIYEIELKREDIHWSRWTTYDCRGVSAEERLKL